MGARGIVPEEEGLVGLDTRCFGGCSLSQSKIEMVRDNEGHLHAASYWRYGFGPFINHRIASELRALGAAASEAGGFEKKITYEPEPLYPQLSVEGAR
jgi:hypothetical protein